MKVAKTQCSSTILSSCLAVLALNCSTPKDPEDKNCPEPSGTNSTGGMGAAARESIAGSQARLNTAGSSSEGGVSTASSVGASTNREDTSVAGGSTIGVGGGFTVLSRATGGVAQADASGTVAGRTRTAIATGGAFADGFGGTAGTSASAKHDAGSVSGSNGVAGIAGAAGDTWHGLSCNENALAQGQSSATGASGVVTYFSLVANYKVTAGIVADLLVSAMIDLKAQLGLPASATPAEVVSLMKAQFHLDGNVRVVHGSPNCQVSAIVAATTAAKCDSSLNSEFSSVKCLGRCVSDLIVTGGKISCGSTTVLHCTTPSADTSCQGSCKGRCEGVVATSCAGKCIGTCIGQCDVKDSRGNCFGRCDGKCQGECELPTGGSCSGSCQGECSIESIGGACRAPDLVECFVESTSGAAIAACSGNCEGSIAPPPAKIDCWISAKTEAELRAECTAPVVNVFAKMDSAAGVDVSARYATYLDAFKTDLAKLVANSRRADIILQAGVDLTGRIPEVTSSYLITGFSCALVLMPRVTGELAGATTRLTIAAESANGLLAAFR